jgi:hypothetical protein
MDKQIMTDEFTHSRLTDEEMARQVQAVMAAADLLLTRYLATPRSYVFDPTSKAGFAPPRMPKKETK